MSIDSQLIVCSGCEYETRELFRPLDLVYRLENGSEVGARQHRGWCYNCESYRTVEFADRAALVAELAGAETLKLQAVRDLESQPAGLFQWFRSRHARREIKFQLAEIEIHIAELQPLLKVLEGRRAGSRCLVCGSDQTEPLYFSGTTGVAEAFRHPCGGQLRIVPEEEDPDPIRFHFRVTRIVLDREGRQLEGRY